VNNPIVFVELHLLVLLILTKSYTPKHSTAKDIKVLLSNWSASIKCRLI